MIPERTKNAIDRYLKQGIPPGDFLYAVLTNNLTQAFGRADSENLANLKDIVSYCYWEIPATSWGSPERVDKWLESYRIMTKEGN